nr:uncharacterized protein LOC113736458 [Coffea arabica]
MANMTIDSFFKKRHLEPSGSGETPCPLRDSSPKHQTKKFCRAESLEFDISFIEHDPGKRKSIWEYLELQRDEVAKNRLQLQVSIDAAKWCAFQAVAFRGHDESLDSNNRALVATSQEVVPVEQFFTYLSLLINLISSSCKRVDQLRVARAARIVELIAIDELETEYEDICSVLIDVINYGNTSTQRSEADRVYDFITSFDFVLVMHMMRDIFGFAQVLSQALQCKSQDILNALKLVSVTKDRLQCYRDNGWNELFTNVKTFCDARNIEMPDMNVIYKASRGRIRKQNDPITM